ncbi:hypothetical protein SAMN05216351_1303 [Pseudobutyrivibrio sp. JW11]|uniref:hypothetical protein n=1 Tax=Pseudobutyrivibrio sp. JW11 TaxID=1855302 RepID=UPI0008DFACA2|nr:hypothetical protein [Pseudobutyrivibrio sp. JW11]SFO67218.1 hypothetical protein SAMN05216351_1303 [Pseudobutyrivibrio sp. JW11]
MLRKIFLLLCEMSLILTLLVGCGKEKIDNSNVKEDTTIEDTSEGCKKIKIPTIESFWATEDNHVIYFLENKQLYSYDVESKVKELVTSNIIDPYDIAVNDGNIYTIEHIDSNDDSVRLFKYEKNSDTFFEVADLPEDTIEIYCSDDYLVVVENSTFSNEDGKYLVFDVSNPEKPNEMELSQIEVEKEKSIVTLDDKQNVFFQEKCIFDNTGYNYDVVTIWGYNDSDVYISTILEGKEEFFIISLDELGNITKLDENAVKVAVFNSVALIKISDGSVLIE